MPFCGRCQRAAIFTSAEGCPLGLGKFDEQLAALIQVV
jgi:hypothetical protein